MPSTRTKTIKIDIISDIICPWCYIGKSRLYRAMKRAGKGYDFLVDMQPFLLYPHIPKGGLPKESFNTARKPGMGSHLKQEAARENLIFNYQKIHQIPNTLEAHRLMYLCPNRDQRKTLGMALFRSYFEKGENIESPEVLRKLAKEVDLDAAFIQQFLKTKEGAIAVKQKIGHFREKGVAAIPAFLLNNEHLIMGVQAIENWLRYFQRVKEFNQ